MTPVLVVPMIVVVTVTAARMVEVGNAGDHNIDTVLGGQYFLSMNVRPYSKPLYVYFPCLGEN